MKASFFWEEGLEEE